MRIFLTLRSDTLMIPVSPTRGWRWIFDSQSADPLWKSAPRTSIDLAAVESLGFSSQNDFFRIFASQSPSIAFHHPFFSIRSASFSNKEIIARPRWQIRNKIRVGWFDEKPSSPVFYVHKLVEQEISISRLFVLIKIFQRICLARE